MNTWNDIQRFWRRAQMPATLILIAANVLTWLFHIFGSGGRGGLVPTDLLGFVTNGFPLPVWWGVFTWPLLGTGDPISLLFGCAWAYTIGGSLERSWGTRTLVAFFAATSVLMALSVWVGAALLHTPGYLSGLWESLAPITLAWCLINRRETINLYFMPVPAMFIGYLSLLLLWWRVGPPFLGFFALIPCGLAWWYAVKGRYSYNGYGASSSSVASSPTLAGFRARFVDKQSPTASSRPSPANRESLNDGGSSGGFNPVRWWKRRQENRKLEAMFRRSGYTDDEKKP